MKKSLITPVIATAIFISGCAPIAQEPPGDGPATTQAAAPSAEVTKTTSTSSAAPSSVPTASASATPTASPSPEPSTEPPIEAPAPTASAIPGATLAPPTSEPAPDVPAVPAVPAGEIITPNVEWGVATTTVNPGASFTITGAGYEPGQRISVSLGVAQSDFFIFQDESAFADAVGNYSFTITIDADLEPRTYAVVTSTPDEAEPVPAGPDTRRWATIEVVAP